MNYITDDGEVIKLPLFMKKIGEGEEGKIYQYDYKTAIKVFKHIPKKELEQKKEVSIELKKVATQNFIRPEKLLLSRKERYKAYTMPLIKLEDAKKLTEIKIITLIELLDELYKDAKELAKTKCLISDYNPENIVITDKIYFIDTTSYGLMPELTKEKVEKINRKRINYMILSKRLHLELYYLQNKDYKVLKQIETFYRSFIENEYSSIQDFLEKESLKKYDNIKMQIKDL